VRTLLTKTTLIAILMFGFLSPVAMGQRRHDSDRRCRFEYNRAVRQANHLRGPAKRAQLAEARREYNDCRRHH